jgi:hypothetical protein
MFVKFTDIGDSVEGTFVSFEENVPSKFGDETQLLLKGADGPKMVRCTTKLASIIKDNIKLFVKGANVKITFTSEVPTTKGNPMKDYEVDVEPPTAGAKADEDIPF